MPIYLVSVEGKVGGRFLKRSGPTSIIPGAMLFGALLKEGIDSRTITDVSSFADSVVFSDLSLMRGGEPLISGYWFFEKFSEGFHQKKPHEKKKFKRVLLTPSEISDLINGEATPDQFLESNGQPIQSQSTLNYSSLVRKGRGKEQLFSARELYIKNFDSERQSVSCGFLAYLKNNSLRGSFQDCLDVLSESGFGADKSAGYGLKFRIEGEIEEKLESMLLDNSSYRVSLGQFYPLGDYLVEFGRLVFYNAIKDSPAAPRSIRVLSYPKGTVVYLRNGSNRETPQLLGENIKIPEAEETQLIPLRALSFGVAENSLRGGLNG